MTSGYDAAYLVAERGRGRAHLLATDEDGMTYTGRALCGLAADRLHLPRRGEDVCRTCDKAANRLDRPRQVYNDGQVTLYHGDCRDILPTVDPDDFAVLVTDPPYGIAYKSNRPRATLADSIVGDEDTSLRDDVLDWWGDRPALVFGTWRRPRPQATRQVLVWDTKGANGMGALDLPWKPSHQEVYVLGSGFSGHRGTDVLRCAPVQSTAKNGRLHPHQKPLPLLRDLLSKCPEGAVLDPFAGSGSTLRAAADLGRPAVGIEVEEGYCEVAMRRFAQQAFDLSGGAA